MQKLLLTLPLFATACGGGFEPMSGDYTVEMTAVEDGCGIDDDMTDTGGEVEANITSIMISDDGTTVTMDDATVCDLDGNVFTCMETSEVFDASTMDETLDAVFSTMSDISMEWTAADMIEGDFSFGLMCEGADCEAVSTDMDMAECSSTFTVALTMVEDVATEG